MKPTVTDLGSAYGENAVLAALEQVCDPELGVDIVNLGLVYELHLAGETVSVVMTLTTPGCPLHGSIRREVLRQLERLPGPPFVEVRLVWEPPWTPERMSEAARRQLGWR